MKTPIKGTTLFIILSSGISPKDEATKMFTPKGGVTKPIAKLTTIIIPKYIGFIPKLVMIGINKGVKINIAGVVSITIPTNNKNILIKINRIIFEDIVVVIKAPI